MIYSNEKLFETSSQKGWTFFGFLPIWSPRHVWAYKNTSLKTNVGQTLFSVVFVTMEQDGRPLLSLH